MRARVQESILRGGYQRRTSLHLNPSSRKSLRMTSLEIVRYDPASFLTLALPVLSSPRHGPIYQGKSFQGNLRQKHRRYVDSRPVIHIQIAPRLHRQYERRDDLSRPRRESLVRFRHRTGHPRAFLPGGRMGGGGGRSGRPVAHRGEFGRAVLGKSSRRTPPRRSSSSSLFSFDDGPRGGLLGLLLRRKFRGGSGRRIRFLRVLPARSSRRRGRPPSLSLRLGIRIDDDSDDGRRSRRCTHPRARADVTDTDTASGASDDAESPDRILPRRR
mmetsp:Transcript_19012/g.55186  ORF Transcript_19012/g.55186 Transcript_19012/m.55186 type:complete len:272 (+) Transcript_19012:875-1690(+)